MTDAAQFDLKKLTERLEAIARQPVTSGGVALERMTTFGTGSARTTAKVAVAVTVRSVEANAAAPEIPAALPLPPPTIDDLKEALRAAVQIEFTTIPLYLTALWSIIDQAHPVAKSIRAVVHEEMLHLSLLCNLLSALGERPIRAIPVHWGLEFEVELLRSRWLDMLDAEAWLRRWNCLVRVVGRRHHRQGRYVSAMSR